MRDLLRETQLEGLGEAPLKGLEGEMVEDSIPKVLWKEMKDIDKKRNGQFLQVMEEKGGIFPSLPLQPTDHIPGCLPTPTPSEDRLFTDWSSIRSGFPLVRSPPQSISVGDVLTTHGIEGGHETDQITLQPSQLISEQTHMGFADDAIQGNLPITPTIHQQPLDRPSVTGERRVNDIGTNTSDVIVEPARDQTRTLDMKANAQTSTPIVDVMLPSNLGDHVTIPHVNLSISGYEPDSLRTSGVRSPSEQPQEVSAIPKLDGPRSLPMRGPVGGQMDGFSRQSGWESSQGDTYVQRAPAFRQGEYPGRESNSNGPRRSHQNWRPPDRKRYPNRNGRFPDQGGYPGGEPPGGGYPNRNGRPLEEADTLMEDLLMEMEDHPMEEDPLDLLVDKDHLALKDHLDQ